MDVIFLGGIFVGGEKERIYRRSRGVMQMAADTLQKNYLSGLDAAETVKTLTVINLPFIGSFPKRYQNLVYAPAANQSHRGRASIINCGFFNLAFVKNLHRAYVASRAMLGQLKERSEKKYIICYSMHLPFLLACYSVKVLRPNVHLCIIVPDLPEFMAVRRGVLKFVFDALAKVSYHIVNRSDSVVAITEQMLGRFDTPVKVVVEGIVDPDYIELSGNRNVDGYFLYTGTLDRRYGIRTLVDSYINSGVKNFKLVVCGAGDDQAYVEAASSNHPGIEYRGQLARQDVLQLQLEATLLINPRGNDSEYTKYSFPSKVIEYMSSGVPVLMYRLDGIPKQYYDFCFVISPGEGGLESALREVASMSSEALERVGQSAKSFIVENKMPAVQVGKLLKSII